MNVHQYEGFKDLEEELKKYVIKAEQPLKILEVGAKEMVKDLLKLPKPKSKIRKSGYTHLIDTFAYRVTKDDVEVGWGKWYGKIIEYGFNLKIKGHPKKMHLIRKHFRPVFDKNKEKYYNLMLKNFNDI